MAQFVSNRCHTPSPVCWQVTDEAVNEFIDRLTADYVGVKALR